jgi:hypothetical protein
MQTPAILEIPMNLEEITITDMALRTEQGILRVRLAVVVVAVGRRTGQLLGTLRINSHLTITPGRSLFSKLIMTIIMTLTSQPLSIHLSSDRIPFNTSLQQPNAMLLYHFIFLHLFLREFINRALLSHMLIPSSM